MKKIAILIFVFLFFGAFGNSAFAETRRYVVSPGEYIWKISRQIRQGASLDASNGSIAKTAERIITYSGLDMAMNNGVVTNDPNDPDYLSIGQVLIVPVLGSKEEVKNTSEPTPPTQVTRIPTSVNSSSTVLAKVTVTNEDDLSLSLGLADSSDSINAATNSLNLVSSSISGITEEIDSIDSHGNDQKIEDLVAMIENLKTMVEGLTTRVEVLKSIKTRHSRTSSSLLENN